MGMTTAEVVRRAFEDYETAAASDRLSPQRSVYEAMDAAGLIGCLDDPDDPVTDLSTNPKHMEDFGIGSRGC
jgi:hypothetical protein